MKIITVGRSQENNNIIVNDEKVSRNHIQLVQDDQGNCSVTDLGSTNGTYVNGQRISGQTPLHTGDELRIGNTILPWQNYFKSGQTGGAYIPSKTKTRNGSGTSSKSPKRKWWLWVIIGIVVLLLAGGIVWWASTDSSVATEPTPTPSFTTEQESLELQKADATNAYLKAKNEADSLKAIEKSIEDSLKMQNLTAEKKRELKEQQDKLTQEIKAKQSEVGKKENELKELNNKLENLEKEKQKYEQEAKENKGKADAEKQAKENVQAELKLVRELQTELNSFSEYSAWKFCNSKKWNCLPKDAKNTITSKFDAMTDKDKKNLIAELKKVQNKNEVEETKPTADTTQTTPANNSTTPTTQKEKRKKK